MKLGHSQPTKISVIHRIKRAPSVWWPCLWLGGVVNNAKVLSFYHVELCVTKQNHNKKFLMGHITIKILVVATRMSNDIFLKTSAKMYNNYNNKRLKIFYQNWLYHCYSAISTQLLRVFSSIRLRANRDTLSLRCLGLPWHFIARAFNNCWNLFS